jgi:hypothetical protein
MRRLEIHAPALLSKRPVVWTMPFNRCEGRSGCDARVLCAWGIQTSRRCKPTGLRELRARLIPRRGRCRPHGRRARRNERAGYPGNTTSTSSSHARSGHRHDVNAAP